MGIVEDNLREIYKELASLSKHFDSENFDIIFNEAIDCAARIRREFVDKYQIPPKDKLFVTLVAASLAYGAYALDDELGFKIKVPQWLNMLYGSDIPEGKKDLFVTFQVLMLSDEHYDICHQERNVPS